MGGLHSIMSLALNPNLVPLAPNCSAEQCPLFIGQVDRVTISYVNRGFVDLGACGLGDLLLSSDQP